MNTVIWVQLVAIMPRLVNWLISRLFHPHDLVNIVPYWQLSPMRFCIRLLLSVLRLSVLVIGLLQLALFGSGPQDMQKLADHVFDKVPAILRQIEGPVQVAIVQATSSSVNSQKSHTDNPPVIGGRNVAGTIQQATVSAIECRHAPEVSPSQPSDRPRARSPPSSDC